MRSAHITCKANSRYLRHAYTTVHHRLPQAALCLCCCCTLPEADHLQDTCRTIVYTGKSRHWALCENTLGMPVYTRKATIAKRSFQNELQGKRQHRHSCTCTALNASEARLHARCQRLQNTACQTSCRQLGTTAASLQSPTPPTLLYKHGTECPSKQGYKASRLCKTHPHPHIAAPAYHCCCNTPPLVHS